ncbi:hypothetical protein, partial [Italian clover phyllody phytoplasma]|uniref:hypothetical protein n=1 Tax=Italian clover phyllody phytoplasma TaxID=1196420 RepID=UPI000371AF6C
MKKLKQKDTIFNIEFIFTLISIMLTTSIICIFINHNFKEYVDFQKDHLKENINHQNNHLKENINLVEKEIDKFQQETQSNFQKINENIDKLEKMIINQN